MDSDSDSQQPHSFGGMDLNNQSQDEGQELSGNYSQLSEDDDLTQQILNKYHDKGLISNRGQEREEEDCDSENQDQVNDISFNQENEVNQEEEEEDENEGEDEEEEEQQEEESEEDQEMGEMKSKFDKIMANFIEDNKKKPQYAFEKKEDQIQRGINEYKNKNLQNNVKGIFKNIVQDQKIKSDQSDTEDSEVEHHPQVEGPNKENDEQSVNIKFNSRKHFPEPPKIQSKPPMPKSVLKNNQNEVNKREMSDQEGKRRASTPDREQEMRENMVRNKSVRCSNSRIPTASQRPKSAKVQIQRASSQQRPKTAVIRKDNKENQLCNQEEQFEILKKPGVPKQTQIKRPQTAYTQKSNITLKKKQTTKNKKTDPVSRYQNLQNEWKRNNFLKGNSNKQGRKLDLDRFNKWNSLTQAYNNQNQNKKGQVHKYIQNQKAPTEDRRDDLRFQLRAKISQKNYVDKGMKNFHYHQDQRTPLQNALRDPIVGEANDKLEQLKKQINHLKKCIE